MMRYEKITYGSAALITGVALSLIFTTIYQAGFGGVDKATRPASLITLPALPNTTDDDPTVEEFASRPIFTSTRRPTPHVAEDAVTSADTNTTITDLPFIVVGIVTATGNKMVAIKHPGDLEATSLHVGQAINGWTIENIRSNSVILRSGNSIRNLRLSDDKGSGKDSKN